MDLITVDLQVPQWIPNLALPFGFTLISIRLLQVFWWIYTGRMINVSMSGELDSDEIEDVTECYISNDQESDDPLDLIKE